MTENPRESSNPGCCEVARRDAESLRILLKATETECAQLRAQWKSVCRDLDELRRMSAASALLEATDQIQGFKRETCISQLTGQNLHFASLYVTLARLYGAATQEEVLSVLREIIANVIGSEEAAVLDLTGDSLRIRAEFGADLAADRKPLANGHFRETALSGKVWGGECPGDAPNPDLKGLSACIPLKFNNRVTGAIAIFSLLPQKQELTSNDFEVMDVLSDHAARALHFAELTEKGIAG